MKSPLIDQPPGPVRRVPHIAALGGELVYAEQGKACLRLPYRDDLVGDPATGVLHGGVITAVLDSASGMAVHSRLEKPMRIATLDLRIDFMGPATPGEAVVVESECFRVTRNVAFVRGIAHHGDAERPFATSVATFMLIESLSGVPDGK